MGTQKKVAMVAPVIVAGVISTGGTLTAKAMAGKWTVGLMVALASYFYWEDDSRSPADNAKFTQLTRELNATVTGLDAIMSASVDCTKLENRADPKCFSVNVDKRHNFANTSKQFGTFAADLCKRASAGTSDMLKHSSIRRYAMIPIHAVFEPNHTWTTNYVKSDDPVCSDMAAKASNIFTNLKNTFPKSKDAKENAELHARMLQAQNTSMTLGQGTGPVRVKTYPALQQFLWDYGCKGVFSPERWDTYDGWEMIGIVIVGLGVLGLAGAALRPWFMNLKDSCAFLKTVGDVFPLIVGGTVYAYAMYSVPDNRWWITCIAIVFGLVCFFWREFFPKPSDEPSRSASSQSSVPHEGGAWWLKKTAEQIAENQYDTAFIDNRKAMLGYEDLPRPETKKETTSSSPPACAKGTPTAPVHNSDVQAMFHQAPTKAELERAFRIMVR